MAGKKVEEIIEAFKKLPKEEQDKVIAHFFGAKSLTGSELVSEEVSDEFKRIASEVFDRNDELFRKLAD